MKNKDIMLNIIIIILVVCIFGVIGYYVWDNYFNEIDVNNEQNIIYKVEDYLSVESAEIVFETDRLNIEKVVFKNIDASVVNEFVDKQNVLINMATINYNYWATNNFEGLSSKDGLVAYSDIWYQINGNILSVYYNMYFEDAMGPCNDIAVINLDLESKKVITNEDLLKLADFSFKKIADDNYNNTLASVKECNKKDSYCRLQDKNYDPITVDKFIEEKSKYINMIVEGLDGVINCYIKDGKIKYDYKRYAIDNLYLGVGKGGCIDYITVEVGTYK